MQYTILLKNGSNLEHNFTVNITIQNNGNYNQNLFYLTCLLEKLKEPNELLEIKDFSIIKNNTKEKT